MIFLSQSEDFYKVIEAIKDLKAPTDYIADRTTIYGYQIVPNTPNGASENRAYSLSHCLFFEEGQVIRMIEFNLSSVKKFNISDADVFIESITIGESKVVAHVALSVGQA